ncbi:MAG: hypothetical protein JWN63_2292 [Candidatus Acidoferrum typicum]|nr:hypothetical protein [Candidatus Acidoferrum typicum]
MRDALEPVLDLAKKLPREELPRLNSAGIAREFSEEFTKKLLKKAGSL